MTEFTSFIVSLISISFLVVLVYWLYRDYRIDLSRQRLFRLRDELFDTALDLGIPFEANAYGMLRSTINGTIRFSHRLSLTQMMAFMFMTRTHSALPGKSFSDRFDEALKTLNEEQATALREKHMRLSYLMMEHIVFSSPVLLFTIVVPVGLFLDTKRRITTIFKSLIDSADSAAFEIGRV